MVRVFASTAMAVAAFYAQAAAATTLSFQNSCSYAISLYDNSATESLAAGSSTSRTLSSGFSGMFRDGSDDEATLAEFAVSGGSIWYDISVIPPGSGSCSSYEACKELTGKTGYNVAMSIAPDSSSSVSSCTTVTCESESCPDAYLYPSDDSKTHSCPDTISMTVTFCPGGSSSSTASSSTTTTSAPATTTSAPAATTSALAATTSAPPTYTESEIESDYDAGTVTTAGASSTSSSTTSTTTTTSTTSSSGATSATFADATINYSFLYNGTDAGSATGTYGKVTEMSSCTTEDVTVTDPVGPLSEEVTMVFRGPMEIYNIAVFNGSSGSDWTKVSSYSAENQTQDNMVFMNNLNIDYTGADSSPQGYASADGASTATESTTFNGSLADASDPSVTGGGPGVSTGVEVNIMTGDICNSTNPCDGYYDDLGYHGWDGGMKMFVAKLKMPTGSTVNRPAVWMLNAQVVRANQYGCNCRGSGAVGGCGELDIAEVIETNTDKDEVSTHYYFYDGSVAAGGDNFGARPTDSTVTYVIIIDNSGVGQIKILGIGGDDFDFSVESVAASQVTSWLDATVSNLLTA